MKVYLAGALENANIKSAETWRSRFSKTIERAGYEPICPLKLVESVLDPFATRDDWVNSKGQNADFLKVADRIVNQDLNLIDRCDAVLFYFENIFTAGSYGEVTVAKYIETPVIVVVAEGVDMDDLPIWVFGCASMIALESTFLSETKSHLDRLTEDI